MVYSLTYRRPAYVEPSRSSLDSEKGSARDSVSSGSSCPFGIPDALSFERIVNGGTCPVSMSIAIFMELAWSAAVPPSCHEPLRTKVADKSLQPCTLREFMDFSKYIERNPENLQFYLWHRDYLKRFDNLPDSERNLAPEWTVERANAEAEAARLEEKPKKVNPTAAAVLKGTDFDTKPGKAAVSDVHPDPFKDPPQTPKTERDSMAPSNAGGDHDTSTLVTPMNPSKTAAAAFESVNVPQPCTHAVLGKNL